MVGVFDKAQGGKVVGGFWGGGLTLFRDGFGLGVTWPRPWGENDPEGILGVPGAYT